MFSYTFPPDSPNPTLAGRTFTGGRIAEMKGQQMIAFAEPLVHGKPLYARLADKPALKEAWARHLAANELDRAAAAAAREAEHPGITERQRLAETEYNTYSPEHFPGSAAWRRNQAAADALAAFDAEHPELVEWLRAEKARKDREAYDALSDFVKAGS